jgi:hypothetical protein
VIINKINKIGFFTTVIAFSIFMMIGFIACDDEEPEEEQEFVFNLDKYFTIEVGELSLQPFLDSDTATVDEAPAVDSVYGEVIVPDGGVNEFNILLNEPAQSIIIGVANESGFYQIFAPESGPVDEFSVNIDFAEEDFKNVYYLLFAGIDEDGNVGPADSTKVIMVDAALGTMEVTCEWDTLVDIDLYLQEPNGDTIYFDNPTSANQGFLDMDSNPFCWLDSVNTEVIYYDETAAVEAGTYNILLRYLSNCEVNEPVQYTITVKFNNEVLDIAGIENPFTGSFNTDETFINPKEILSFNIASDATKSTSFAKQKRIRFGYSNNKPENHSLSPEKSQWERNRNKEINNKTNRNK